MIKSLTYLSDLNMRTGADILLEVLESEGVEYIFGNPGTTELPLIDALLRHENIHYILALQESTVVAIADGYAKRALSICIPPAALGTVWGISLIRGL